MQYEIDEQARILWMDLVSAGSADKVLTATLALIKARPELCSWDWIVECQPLPDDATGWDWIVECQPLPDDATVDHLSKLAQAWGAPPTVEALTVFVTQDRLLHLWARVMDFQFLRRKHLVERDVEAARRLIERRRAERPLR